ncbi:MAG: hypothetical protein LBU35_01200 [Holosporales bacterium]|nr:hypothetical protein [Holosporales bacterium]
MNMSDMGVTYEELAELIYGAQIRCRQGIAETRNYIQIRLMDIATGINKDKEEGVNSIY